MKRKKIFILGLTAMYLFSVLVLGARAEEEAAAGIQKESDAAEAVLEEQDGNGLFLADGQETLVSVTAELYQAGAFQTSDSGIMVYSLQTEEMERQIYESLSQNAQSLDVSGWGLTTAQADVIKAMFEHVVNGHPELFYVSNTYQYSYRSDKIISLSWNYQEQDPERVAAMRLAMEAKVSEILEKTEPSMTTVEKLMILHEALVVNTTYTTTTEWNDGRGCYTAYGALVEGRAVCHGYALAFDLLAERLGIQTEFVGSDALDHAWNLVVLDGETYHVDCTWDDRDRRGEVLHQNFMLSDAGIKSTGHGIWNDPGLSGSGTTYDDYYWRDQAYNYEFIKSNSVWYQISRQGASEEAWRRIGVSLLIPETLSPAPMPPWTLPVSVRYQAHVQSQGWQEPVSDGKTAGTVDQAKRLEAVKIEVTGNADLGIAYQAHVQSQGWQDEVSGGDMAGTVDQAKRMEAVRIRLTGADAEDYDVYYRVHVQSYGWLDWAKNGESAGTEGLAKRLEAIEVQIVEKGSVAPGSIERPFVKAEPAVSYQAHVQSYGWQNTVSDGALAGTTGKAKRMEAVRISLSNLPVSGSIRYQAHVQSQGWQDWVSNGTLAGTSGEAKRLEAIRIELTGEFEKQYDVYYRVHVQSQGWQGWVKNGEIAGTTAKAKRLEAIEIRIEKKK
jgi:uncharacterized protein YjdB